MATASDIRAWAAGQGYQVPARGNIPGTIRTAYDAAHPAPNGSGGTPHADYPDDDFESAFVDPPDDDVPDEAAVEETAPRRPKGKTRSSATSRGTRKFWPGRPKADGKGKKKAPRVSTEDVIGGAWRVLAKLATPMPPLSRTLRIQAPVAGAILDDAVKDTVTDTLLQPVARLAGQGKVVSALAGPPVIVTALSLHIQQRAMMDPPQEPNPFFVQMGIEALRSSLMMWMEISGPKFEQALRREKEFEDKYGQSVDDLIGFLLAPPVDPADQAAVIAEEEAIRRAQGIVVDA